MTSCERIVIRVPDLPERPYVASTCCAVLAEELIAEDLGSWPQVAEVEIDVAEGRIELVVTQPGPPLDYVLDSLAMLGYSATVAEDDARA